MSTRKPDVGTSFTAAEDKVSFFVGPGPHGTPLASREAIYEWMIRWLKDGQGDSHEQPVKLYANHELFVTRSGHVDDEPGSRKLNQLILDDFHAKKRPGTIPGLLAELRRLRIPSEAPPPEVKVLEESSVLNVRRLHIKFESEPGVEVEESSSSVGRKPAVLLVADKTSTPWIPSTSSLAERMAKARCVDDCRILEEADDGHRPLTLWADERIGFVDLLDEARPLAPALPAK